SKPLGDPRYAGIGSPGLPALALSRMGTRNGATSFTTLPASGSAAPPPAPISALFAISFAPPPRTAASPALSNPNVVAPLRIDEIDPVNHGDERCSAINPGSRAQLSAFCGRYSGRG